MIMPTYVGQRIGVLRFADSLLLMLCVGRYEVEANELPRTAQAVGGWYEGCVFHVVVEDESFPVYLGGALPLLPPPRINTLDP